TACQPADDLSQELRQRGGDQCLRAGRARPPAQARPLGDRESRSVGPHRRPPFDLENNWRKNLIRSGRLRRPESLTSTGVQPGGGEDSWILAENPCGIGALASGLLLLVEPAARGMHLPEDMQGPAGLGGRGE